MAFVCLLYSSQAFGTADFRTHTVLAIQRGAMPSSGTRVCTVRYISLTASFPYIHSIAISLRTVNSRYTVSICLKRDHRQRLSSTGAALSAQRFSTLSLKNAKIIASVKAFIVERINGHLGNGEGAMQMGTRKLTN